QYMSHRFWKTVDLCIHEIFTLKIQSRQQIRTQLWSSCSTDFQLPAYLIDLEKSLEICFSYVRVPVQYVRSSMIEFCFSSTGRSSCWRAGCAGPQRPNMVGDRGRLHFMYSRPPKVLYSEASILKVDRAS